MKISVLTSLLCCQDYLERYFAALKVITNPDQVEVLLLHNAPTPPECDLITTALQHLSDMRIKHIKIPVLESLYATWNRGVYLSTGEYIAVWNVDDIRLPDSLERQAATLDRDPKVGLTYGDIIGIRNAQDRTGVYYNHPDYSGNEREFFRSFYSSCFPMWRKSVHEVVGYFDEQFKVVGDFDFQIRIARRFPLAKTHGLLGYYLEGDTRKLTSAYNRLERERTVIELRYGQFDKLNLLFVLGAVMKHNILHIHKGIERVFLPSVFPKYWSFIVLRFHLLIGSLVKFPLYVVRYVRHGALERSVREA